MTTYIRQLGKAIDKMPAFQGDVYRGLSVQLPEGSYPVGGVVCWQSFASATKSVFETLNFLLVQGLTISGTLVIIKSEIELLSQFPHEQEVLFTYNTFFLV